MPSTLIVK